MKNRLIKTLFLLLIPGYLFAGEVDVPEFPPGDGQPIPGGSTDSFELLFLGNSHSAANGLPGLVTTMLETGMQGASANSGLAPGYLYLADRLTDGVTEPMLNGNQWTHVVLQAQKYSSSGLYHYPTDAAEEWIRRTKGRNALPILFPEWPRRGNDEEGLRVHNLHLGIASREPACVAPVGLAWEAALDQYPDLVLHAPDGNHSSLNGALLTAYVFYELMSGQTAAQLPYIPSINVSQSIQSNLSEVASVVVVQNRQTCPQSEQAAESPVEKEIGIPALAHWGLMTLAMSLVITGGVVLRR